MNRDKQNFVSKIRVFYFFGLGSLICCLLSGCIRFTGSAGYWHQGAEDEAPKGKQVGFDTQKMVPGYTPGNIEVDDQK